MSEPDSAETENPRIETLENQLRQTDTQLAALQDSALAARTDIAALRASSRVAAQLYAEVCTEKAQARDAIVRALTQLREHAPGAAVETLEAWLQKDKAL